MSFFSSSTQDYSDLTHFSIKDIPLVPNQQQATVVDSHNRDEANADESRYIKESLGNDASNKANRLRKACDSCSIRKVKCDESGPPCRACAALDIPCTFVRPSRRRGPPNRYAEAVKKQRLGHSSTNIKGELPLEISSTLSNANSLSAESIVPYSTLLLFVDDYFTYIHPLVPLPHEPTFREALGRRDDRGNPTFLALLAAMIGALVASFPRRPLLHLKAQKMENLFPSSISLLETCHSVCTQARGTGYLDRELEVLDAATSYLLGLIGAYTHNWRQCRLYMGECMNIIRCLGIHRNKPLSNAHSPPPSFPTGTSGNGDEEGFDVNVDFIRREVGRRLFWIIFVAVRRMEQVGSSFGDVVLPPATPSNPYPPLPLEIDDQNIFKDHIKQQPDTIVSELVGFNANVKIYSSYHPLVTMEITQSMEKVFDWDKQRRIVEECLQRSKSIANDFPLELRLISPSNGDYIIENRTPGSVSKVFNNRVVLRGPTMDTAAAGRRLTQFEIQKANIHISLLGTRNYIVDKYWHLREANHFQSHGHSSTQSSPRAITTGMNELFSSTDLNPSLLEQAFYSTEEQMIVEREEIMKDLLRVLGGISQLSLEPNGISINNKIRSIASTLLDQPNGHTGRPIRNAEQYLKIFLDMLMKLEKVSPDDEKGNNDEEYQLRRWADVAQPQIRFARAGGFSTDF